VSATGPIADFIRRELLYDPDAALADDTVIFPDLIDSLGIMEVVDFLEEHFSIDIGDDELLADNFATLGAMSALIARKS
jgi:acyl carrier protein